MDNDAVATNSFLTEIDSGLEVCETEVNISIASGFDFALVLGRSNRKLSIYIIHYK